MANPNDIIQNIIVRIQDDLRDTGRAVAYLRNVSTAAQGATSGINSYSAASSAAVKSMSLLRKAAFTLGAALKAIAAPLILLKDALILVGAAAIGFVKILSNAGKELTAFTAATGKGSKATFNLRNAYKDLVSSGKSVVVTINDIATAMSQFGAQGFAQLQMAGEKSTQAFIASLQNTLSKGLASTDFGAQLTQTVTQAFGDNLASLRTFEQEWLAAGDNLARQQEVLMRYQWVNDEAMTKAIGSIQNLRDQAAGIADPAVAANLTWSEFGNQLLVLLNSVQQEMAKAFGTDTAGLITKLGGYVKDFIVWVQDASKEMRIWGVYAKVLWNWISEGATVAFSLVESAFLKLVSAMLTGFSKVQGFFGFEEGAKQVARAAEDAARDASAAFDRAMNPQFLDMVEELAKAEMENARSSQTRQNAMKAVNEEIDKTVQNNNKIRNQLVAIVQESENWKNSANRAAGLLSTIAELTELIGNNMNIGGSSMRDLLKVGFEDAIVSARKLITESEKGLGLVEELIADARKNNDLQKLTELFDKKKVLLGQILHAHQQIKNAQEAALAPNKANLGLIEAQTSIQKAQLNIAKALYGAPSLGVQALLNINNLLAQETEQLREMLETQKQNIAIMIDKGVEADKIADAQKRIFDLEAKIAEKTAERLNMVKELRDGYLDAIQAQAFASGKFEKIIITQEQNIAMALEKGIAKRNYLLGQVGKEAQMSDRAPVRFSASGMGVLETLDGQSVDLAKYSQNAINNIGDPVNRAASQQGLDAITGIYKGVQGAQIKASVGNTAAIKENTDAINNLIAARAAAIPMLGLKGTAAGGVVTGEAQRRAGEFKNQRKKIEKSIIKSPAAAQESYFTDLSPHGLVTQNLKPGGGKEVADLKKIRERNAKAIRVANQKRAMKNIGKSFREGMRKHWEAHDRMWNQWNRPNKLGTSDISSIDTIARKTDKGFAPETKTGKTLTHGTKNRSSGGGTFTRMIGNVAELLIAAGEKIRDIGPVIDEMDTQDPEVTTSPSGLSGELGQAGAPG